MYWVETGLHDRKGGGGEGGGGCPDRLKKEPQQKVSKAGEALRLKLRVSGLGLRNPKIGFLCGVLLQLGAGVLYHCLQNTSETPKLSSTEMNQQALTHEILSVLEAAHKEP